MTTQTSTNQDDEGHDMTENQLPAAPATDADAPVTHSTPPTARRTWRDRMPKGRKVVAAGAVVAGLAVGGAGFGAGYAVGQDDVATTGTTQTTDDFGQRGFPGDGQMMPGGPMGDQDGDGQMGGQMPGGPMGGTTQDGGGTTGQQPDFDGDGQPDTDSGTGTDDGTTSDSLNS